MKKTKETLVILDRQEEIAAAGYNPAAVRAVVIREDSAPVVIPQPFTAARPRITRGNHKTHIWGVNLLPGADSDFAAIWAPLRLVYDSAQLCGSCCCDCNGCYAQMMARYIGAGVMYAINNIEARENPARFVELVESELYDSAMLPRFFRWHDSGDFVSVEYMRAVFDMARRHPETHFYAYTKRYALLDAIGGVDAIPENFTVNVSPWAAMGVGGYADLPQFIYDDGSDPEIAALPHCPAIDKDGKETGVHCINCRRCVTAARGQKTAIYPHGAAVKRCSK